MFRAHAISFVQLDALWIATALMVIALAWTLLRNIGPRTGQRRLGSILGIALQSLGFAAASVGFVEPSLPWWAPYSMVSSLLVMLLGGTAIALFLWAAATMGRNWSLVARTGEGHELVRSGPFAMVRHPIYLALLLYLLSIAAALGHWQQLMFAMPLYLAGTAVRVRQEEALLRARFGAAHERYVREVPALVPLIG